MIVIHSAPVVSPAALYAAVAHPSGQAADSPEDEDLTGAEGHQAQAGAQRPSSVRSSLVGSSLGGSVLTSRR
jgi:hypothetical protein